MEASLKGGGRERHLSAAGGTASSSFDGVEAAPDSTRQARRMRHKDKKEEGKERRNKKRGKRRGGWDGRGVGPRAEWAEWAEQE